MISASQERAAGTGLCGKQFPPAHLWRIRAQVHPLRSRGQKSGFVRIIHRSRAQSGNRSARVVALDDICRHRRSLYSTRTEKRQRKTYGHHKNCLANAVQQWGDGFIDWVDIGSGRSIPFIQQSIHPFIQASRVLGLERCPRLTITRA